MKRKYLLIAILVLVIVLEIIIVSVKVFLKDNYNDSKEVATIDEEIFNENEEIDTEYINENLKLELQQAKLKAEQYELELKAKWNEIIKKRKALFGKETLSNNENKSNNVNNNSNSSGNSINLNNDTNNSNISGSNTNDNSADNSNVSNNTSIVKISQILNGEKENLNCTNKVEDLGIPLIKKYPNNTSSHVVSRNVWDMQLYNNRIYIGSGDGTSNTGPVDVYYYDLQKEEFVKEATLEDEQISRFVIIDNQLIITGIDPREGWEYGNYFIWKDNSWIKKRTLLGGIHNFDLVKYHGKLFAGLGNDSDSSIVMSKDGGETFSYVYMYTEKDKKLVINTSNSNPNRVYDLIEFNDKLYAFCNKQLYQYLEDENIFMRVNSNYINYGTAPANKNNGLKTKFVYNGRVVLINGQIKYTDNLEDTTKYQTVQFDKTTYTYDAMVINGEIYALCSTPTEKGYIISVNKSNNFTDWETVMYFEYKDFARSFEYSDGCFYLGIGTNLKDSDDGTNSGRILKVKIN